MCVWLGSATGDGLEICKGPLDDSTMTSKVSSCGCMGSGGTPVSSGGSVRAARERGWQRLAEIAGLKELWRGHGLPPRLLPCVTRRLRRRRRSSAHIKALFWSGALTPRPKHCSRGPRPKHCSRWMGQATVGLSCISSSIFLFTDIGNWTQYWCQMGAGLLAV